MNWNFMNGYTYIVECSDGSYYTGSTQNLHRRLLQHNEGVGAEYTSKRRPVKLVYFEIYHRIDLAFQREKQIKGWSRKKKEALIAHQWDLLPKLSVSRRKLKLKSEKVSNYQG